MEKLITYRISESDSPLGAPAAGYLHLQYPINLRKPSTYLKKNLIQGVRRATSTYSVPCTTLSDRRAGGPARRDCQPNLKPLTKVEEKVIVSHILELDSRGFAPTLSAVRDMADQLLTARGAGLTTFLSVSQSSEFD